MILPLLLIPLAVSLLCFISGRNAKTTALLGSVANLALVLFAIVQLKAAGGKALIHEASWIPAIGANFNLSFDGIAAVLVLLSAVLMPLIVYASSNRDYQKPHILYGLMALMQASMVGSFLAADGFLFYIYWEVALIPVYFIVLYWGGKNRQRITLKFFIYTMLGSLFMLFAFIYLQQHTPDKTFDLQALYVAGRSLPLSGQALVMAGIFLAFAVKMPIFPFHTWQPDTYFTAPTPGVMLLSGIMLKMATYGLIRWLLPVVPLAMHEYGHIAIWLSVIGILYASFIAISQGDYKRMVAYASIAHVGLISAGILAGNAQGLQGGLVQMFSHGVTAVGLFFVWDILERRTGGSRMEDMGGIRALDPKLAFLFFIIVLSAVALPLTNGFVGEFLLLAGLFKYNGLMAVLATVSVILGAVYMLRGFQKMMLGEVRANMVGFVPITTKETIVLTVICALIIVFGVYPEPLLSLSEMAVNQMLFSIPK